MCHEIFSHIDNHTLITQVLKFNKQPTIFIPNLNSFMKVNCERHSNTQCDQNILVFAHQHILHNWKKKKMRWRRHTSVKLMASRAIQLLGSFSELRITVKQQHDTHVGIWRSYWVSFFTPFCLLYGTVHLKVIHTRCLWLIIILTTPSRSTNYK